MFISISFWHSILMQINQCNWYHVLKIVVLSFKWIKIIQRTERLLISTLLSLSKSWLRDTIRKMYSILSNVFPVFLSAWISLLRQWLYGPQCLTHRVLPLPSVTNETLPIRLQASSLNMLLCMDHSYENDKSRGCSLHVLRAWKQMCASSGQTKLKYK